MANQRPKVVIIGAGFGGLQAAKALKQAPVDVLMIDRNNYHLFQPLLYQVATALVAPTEIAYPVRAIFRNQKNFDFRLANVTGVDMNMRRVYTDTGPVDYDYLVMAVGGQTNFFGLESVQRNGFPLKDLDDAIAIRNHILTMVEQSTHESDPALCDALRTFIVVGGGPTGVECSGALAELVRLVLVKDFPQLHEDQFRVVLLEMTDRLLTGFPADLAQAAEKRLGRMHVDVRLGASVTDFDGQRVLLKDGEEIPACTLVWAAGVRTEDLVAEAGLPQARQGRAVVQPTLQSPEHLEVFVVGDAAYLEADGKPLPMMAPVAIQQGRLAAQNISRILQGKPLEAFQYKDPGTLATIGRNAAVAQVKGVKFHGFLAWVVWLAVHIFWLIGFRNRLAVLLNWASDYIFYERAVRLITQYIDPRQEALAALQPAAPQPDGREHSPDGRDGHAEPQHAQVFEKVAR